MKSWLIRNREIIIAFLILTVISLFFGVLLKREVLSFEGLDKKKDFFAALNSLLGIIVLVAASLFSYFRFFRGRTFYSRAELKISVTVIETTEDFNIHAIVMSAKNIGTLPIWDPQPAINVYEKGPEGGKADVWDQWTKSKSTISETESRNVIDPGEEFTLTAHHEVNKSIWMVSYTGFIKSHTKEVWKYSVAVPNKPSKSS